MRTASDGAEALAMLAEQPADLVVTDLEMPNVDGFMLTSSIRAQPRLANIVEAGGGDRAARAGTLTRCAGARREVNVAASFDEAGPRSAVSRLLAAPRGHAAAAEGGEDHSLLARKPDAGAHRRARSCDGCPALPGALARGKAQYTDHEIRGCAANAGGDT